MAWNLSWLRAGLFEHRPRASANFCICAQKAESVFWNGYVCHFEIAFYDVITVSYESIKP